MLGDITGLEALALNTSTFDQSHNTSTESDQNIPSSVSRELDYWEKLVFSFDHDMDRESGSPTGNINPQTDVNSGVSSGRDAGNQNKRGRQASSAASSSLNISQSSLSDVGVQAEVHGLSHQGRSQRSDSNVHTPYQYPQFFGQAQGPAAGAQMGQQSSFDPYTLAHLAALSILSAPPPGSEKSGPPSNVSDPISILRQLQGVLHQSGTPSHGGGGGGWPYPAQNSGVGSNPMLGMRPPSNQNTPQLSALRSTQSTTQSSMNVPRPGLTDNWLGQLSYNQQNTSQQSLHSPNILPPLDMSLFNLNQPSQLSQFVLPRSLSTSASQPPRLQPEPGSSSSSSNIRSPATSSSAPSTPVASTSNTNANVIVDEAAVAEDKRRRNTLASGKFFYIIFFQFSIFLKLRNVIVTIKLLTRSIIYIARFRIKKKHKTIALERSVVELEARAEDLDREVTELRRENGWLKEMLIMKGRSLRASSLPSTSSDTGPAASTSQQAIEANEEEGSEKDNESGDEEEEMDLEEADAAKGPAPKDTKGKGKGRAS